MSLLMQHPEFLLVGFVVLVILGCVFSIGNRFPLICTKKEKPDDPGYWEGCWCAACEVYH